MPELPAASLVAFDIDAPDAVSILATLSEGLQSTIQQSPEWQARIARQDPFADDAPLNF